jgi:hypothetical protein
MKGMHAASLLECENTILPYTVAGDPSTASQSWDAARMTQPQNRQAAPPAQRGGL